jgi:basic amino acid/polyamine antiporter, APA family
MTIKDLQRNLGLFPATNIVVANMIGAGIFTTSGLLMSALNDPLLMLALWFAGGIIALCGALSYGELGASMPGSGGEYHFLSELYHPLFGFLSGWVSFTVGFSAPIAAAAMGFSEYFCSALPSVPGWFEVIGIMDTATTKTFLSISVILIFTCIHYFGIKYGALVQNILTISKVALILLLLLAGFLSGRGTISNFISDTGISSGLSGWKTIGLSLMWIMFAYSGWNASTYLGSEIRDPVKTLPLSLISGTAIVMLLYLGLNALYIYSIDPHDIKGVISVGGLAMGKLFGKSAEVLFSLLIAFALFSSLSAFIIIGPRVYYAMAKDGLFFKSAGRLHQRFRVPSNSIILQGIIAIILALSGTFEQVLTYMGFALGIFPILTVTGVFRLRRKSPDAPRLPGYPYSQIIYVTTGILILGLAFLERPLESSIALLTVIAGVPAYFFFSKIHVRGSFNAL